MSEMNGPPQWLLRKWAQCRDQGLPPGQWPLDEATISPEQFRWMAEFEPSVQDEPWYRDLLELGGLLHSRRADGRTPGVVPFDSEIHRPDPTPPHNPARNYFPDIRDARVVRAYDGGEYDIRLLTGIRAEGLISYTHLLVAYTKENQKPSFIVAAEVNEMQGNGGPSHFLGGFPGSGHINYGCSDEWADIEAFEKKALEIMADHLGLDIRPSSPRG